ncbi:tRNA (adenosine(37)-N6)-dimethylallyltransferase MiaA [Nitrosomonas sp.]|uniref:tRNA (adenosine(37)-N6)-dimethylallyltransferase MiaA n=1 Tax=Nitrosomonas sp. TaxID=42353 RepID=UPI001D4FE9E9|nr:tRNA (adenosine(37)-N6)-dimethylallyltransferase MiaA [Nitrosomonas sp.]MBX3616185.1 tRNA (adenosine(37)-N6)-dimethylallyltransferase MiaA [Nitrosomonas sp.]
MQHLPNLLPAIFLLGPTASGKSRIALEIADRFPVEIISVDSAQIYRYMDIGTAKPDPKTLTRVTHHLINLIDPDQRYSAAQFRQDALSIMHEVSQRNKIPLLAGGTMLYFRALQNGLSNLPPADIKLRQCLEEMAKEIGWPAMHRKLSELDEVTAMRIKPTDSQRIQRALEVCHLTQQPMSKILQSPRQSDFPFRTIRIALLPSDRTQLHQRIAERFGTMLDQGFIDEVRLIRQRFPGLNLESPSMRCVGYRQACLFLDNVIDRNELSNMGIAATRQLAKRQLTWLRSMKTTDKLFEFDCLEKSLAAQIKNFLDTAIPAHLSHTKQSS